MLFNLLLPNQLGQKAACLIWADLAKLSYFLACDPAMLLNELQDQLLLLEGFKASLAHVFSLLSQAAISS